MSAATAAAAAGPARPRPAPMFALYRELRVCIEKAADAVEVSPSLPLPLPTLVLILIPAYHNGKRQHARVGSPRAQAASDPSPPTPHGSDMYRFRSRCHCRRPHRLQPAATSADNRPVFNPHPGELVSSPSGAVYPASGYRGICHGLVATSPPQDWCRCLDRRWRWAGLTAGLGTRCGALQTLLYPLVAWVRASNRCHRHGHWSFPYSNRVLP